MHARARLLPVVVVVVVLVSWAGVARAGPMARDARAHVQAMMRDDRLWAEHLDVNVRVDAGLVSPAAASVLRALDALPPGDALTPPADALTVNALAVVAEVASGGGASESDAAEFAVAVAAAAFRCRVLPYVLAQVRAVERAVPMHEPANFRRPRRLWATLVRYADKMARLREPLDAESEMLRAWSVVVRQTLAPTPDAPYGTFGYVRPFRELVEDAVRAACEPGAAESALRALGPDAAAAAGPGEWPGPETARAVFEGGQRELDAAIDGLPVAAADAHLWNDYLRATADRRREKEEM